MVFGAAMGGALKILHSPAVFGEPVTIRKADGSAEFQTHGVPGTDDLISDVNGSAAAVSVHTLGLRRGGLEWVPRIQDLVLRGDQTWVVVNTQDEGQGILTLQLHLDD